MTGFLDRRGRAGGLYAALLVLLAVGTGALSRRTPRALAVAAATFVALAALVPAIFRNEQQDLYAFVGEYCTTCHNSTDWDGGIAFEIGDGRVAVRAFDADEPEAAIWERAVRKVRAGLMPPAEAARPVSAALDQFAEDIESRLDRDWAADPDPGAEPLSRLNRTEYANAIRDLLDFDAAAVVETLPRDETVAGFDNIGDALSVSPTLIESYVSAALVIARQAVGDRSTIATQVRYEAPAGSSQDQHVEGLPLGTRGGFIFTHNFPLDAVYEFRVMAAGRGAIASQTLCRPPDLVTALNGDILDVADPGSFRMRIPAGPQKLAVALADESRCAGVNDLHDVYSVSGSVRHVEIHGPIDPTGPGNTPSRRAIFSCYPETAAAEEPCAVEIMTRLATLAYRRALRPTDREIETLLGFYRQGRAEGDFETGVQHALSRLLMSPRFIFQLEHAPEGLTADAVYAVTDTEIASRLSFFLWSSLPDRELVDVASRGRLSDPATLAAQVARMLADPRAQALVENFAAQWLSLRELREALPQDREFDDDLRQSLEAETKLFVTDYLLEDRNVLGLLDADYTYLNERLARHYGVEGVHGSYMRRVTLDPASPRRGLLGKGSWLTATSVADRTSPVIRGEWYMTHMLGAPVPAPPAGVEADLSDEAAIARESDTLRERLERHRANPTCAACHQIMDPIGLALENFDLVGRWRDTDNGKPVDPSAVLIDGTRIEGPHDLRAHLISRSELFVTALTEKLLTYALGRVVDYRDMPAVRKIVRNAAREDYRFSSIVRGIVMSEPFQQRTAERSD